MLLISGRGRRLLIFWLGLGLRRSFILRKLFFVRVGGILIVLVVEVILGIFYFSNLRVFVCLILKLVFKLLCWEFILYVVYGLVYVVFVNDLWIIVLWVFFFFDKL